MQDHSTGLLKGSRQGANLVMHNFELRSDTHVSGTDYLLGTFAGDTFNPATLRVRAVVDTPDNAVTTSVLRVGTTAGGTDILNDVDIKAAAGTNYATAAVSDIKRARADIQVWARITRVGSSSAGLTEVMVECWDQNITPFTAQGS